MIRVIEPDARVLRSLLAAAPDDVLRPDADYCAAVTATAPAGRLGAPRWSAQVEQDGLVWLLAETAESSALERLLVPDVASGIGLPRQGPDGALRSVVDAAQAFAVSGRRGRPVRFADEWVDATLLAAADALHDVCARAVEVARRSPHLADAVRAFADEGLSVVGAARALHVHANTVIYRLERWQHLTGWDARTFLGLSRSIAALTRESAGQ
jgi:sugar diacid utilization regulator